MSTRTVPSAVVDITQDDMNAVMAVLQSGVLANGPQADRLEKEFSELTTAEHAVAVSSGTDALYVAGRAVGVSGGVVLVPGFTFAATANAFLALDAQVVAVDVDPDTFNMSAASLRLALDSYDDVRAVVPVDLYGNSAGLDEIIEMAEHAGVPVIEDASQAHGAIAPGGRTVGSRALLTTFSLYATKNVFAGEGGLVTTSDGSLARTMRLLRNHGSETQYVPVTAGLNHRLPEMSAALGRSRLRRLASGNDNRRAQASKLVEILGDAWPEVSLPTVPADGSHVFHQFTVRFPRRELRDETARFLRAEGVDVRVFYPYTVAELPGVGHSSVPESRSLTETVLSIPVHPGLTPQQLVYLHEALKAAAVAVPGLSSRRSRESANRHE